MIVVLIFHGRQPWESEGLVRGMWINLGMEVSVVWRKQWPLKKNGYDIKQGFPNYFNPRSTNADVHLQSMSGKSSSSGVNRSWKNFDEEEFKWDAMNSRSSDQAVISSWRNDYWIPDDSEILGKENTFLKLRDTTDFSSRIDTESSTDSLSANQKHQVASLGHRTSSSWMQEPHSTDRISNSGSFQPRGGGGSSNIGFSSFRPVKNPVSGSTGSGQPYSVGAESPGQSPMCQYPLSPSLPHRSHQVLHNLADQDQLPVHILPRLDLMKSQLLRPLNMGPHNQLSKEPFLAHAQKLPLGKPQILSNCRRLLVVSLGIIGAISALVDSLWHFSFT